MAIHNEEVIIPSAPIFKQTKAPRLQRRRDGQFFDDEMAREPIPEDVKRFILTSVPSVPYLEAMLLLRNDPDHPWDAKRLSQRLYVSEKAAAPLLADLAAAGVLAVADPALSLYCYRPRAEELRQMIDRVAKIYARNIVEIANLIHSETSKTAQQFADAFKFRDDK